ncbi:DUF3857 domain-containing transglutaminase family protein [Aureibacter tunicatorum]|uniref:Transglutaminase-like putative cysteine protease n=1 Tax=Aureibacter tunicatorum TaxID=866807 RepID=A0AAE4BSA4_9BACT|nr:DUF3857 domain-containing protein [Aureibacter tunicatorum]MDR6241029.1 transglutaminase-like putative cysteine protease [Aureibacter tunicatorum]BDD03807.1 hypothetical protein AUTU_12900 [Aureibacter tunicatorum]
MKRFYFLLLITLWTAFDLYAENKPNWVEDVRALDPLDENQMKSFGEAYYLLLNKQYHIEEGTYYYSAVIQLLTEQGVQNFSNISITYDPSYEKVNWHEVAVIRGSEKVNKLERSQIKTFHQESEAERFIYNGTKTQSLEVKDVRIGDVLVYSFSRTGKNPVFDDRFALQTNLNFGQKLGKIYYSFIYDSKRNLKIDTLNCVNEINHEKLSLGALVKETWQGENILPIYYEEMVPAWHVVNMRLQISEYPTWKSVVDWAMPLYTLQNIAPVIKEKVNEVKRQYPNKSDQITALIRFVQDEIRYLGFEDGIHGYKPHDPTQIFSQRYGDCKDKAFLLIHMLDELNVEAYAALVNSSNNKIFNYCQPSPYVFDHCIVVINDEGENIWVDATFSSQGGSYREIFCPNYGKALVLRKGESVLTEVSKSKNYKRIINEYLDVNEHGKGGVFEIQSEYYGGEADEIRDYIRKTDLSRMKKNYTDFYAKKFMLLSRDSTDIRIEDDREKNVLKVKEKYHIEQLWRRSSDHSAYVFDIGPYTLGPDISYPSTNDRKMPFALKYPLNVEHNIWLSMPTEWSIESEEFELVTDYFEGVYEAVYNEMTQTVELHFKYHTKSEEVSLADIHEFVSFNEKLDQNYSFQLIDYDYVMDHAGKKITNSNMSYLFLLVFLAVSIFIFYKLDNSFDPEVELDYEESGKIAGVYYFIAVLVGLSPIINFFIMVRHQFLKHSMWNNMLTLIDKKSLFADIWAMGHFIEYFYIVFSFGMSVFLVYQFYYRRRSFVVLFGVFLVVQVLMEGLFYLIDLFMLNGNEKYAYLANPSAILFALVKAILWGLILYFFKDDLKHTFVYNRKVKRLEYY